MGSDRRQLTGFEKPSSKAERQRDISLKYLVDLPEEAFVDAAFQLLLKRPPDPTETHYYCNRLLQGKPRMWALDRLVRSEEVRSDWQDLPHLSAALGQYRKSSKRNRWFQRDAAPGPESISQSIFMQQDHGFSPESRQLVDYFRNPTADGKFYLEYLMELPDMAFVDAAFRALLKRPSDPAGLRYYSDRLQRGKPRMWVLDRLARSTEVRPDWRYLPDLAVAIGHYRKIHKFSGALLALRDATLQWKRMPANGDGLQKDDRSAMAAVSAQQKPSPFIPPEPRRIDDVREADLPDRIKAVVNMLDR